MLITSSINQNFNYVLIDTFLFSELMLFIVPQKYLKTYRVNIFSPSVLEFTPEFPNKNNHLVSFTKGTINPQIRSYTL